LHVLLDLPLDDEEPLAPDGAGTFARSELNVDCCAVVRIALICELTWLNESPSDWAFERICEIWLCSSEVRFRFAKGPFGSVNGLPPGGGGAPCAESDDELDADDADDDDEELESLLSVESAEIAARLL
jgi:hypothetical protein